MFTQKVIELTFDLTGEEDTRQYLDAYVDGESVKLPLMNPFRLPAKAGYKALITCDQPDRIIVVQVEHRFSTVSNATGIEVQAPVNSSTLDANENYGHDPGYHVQKHIQDMIDNK